MIEGPVAVSGVIAATTGLAFWIERRFAWGPKVGAALIVIVLGALLSNLGLVPVASPVYEAIFGPVTSLAIVWLLFAVDLADLRDAGPTMLLAFLIAVLATAAGAVAATLAFAPAFPDHAWRLAGALTGTYTGGSLNFVAVGRGLGMPASLFTAAAAADAAVTALWFGATLLLPLWLGRFYRPPRWKDAGPARASGDVTTAPPAAASPDATASPDPAGSPAAAPPANPFVGEERPGVLDAALLLALGFGLLWAAEALGAAFPAIPAILWLTTLALAVAQLPPVKRLEGAAALGYLALHFFLALIGIASRFSEVAAVGFEVLWLTVAVVAVHGVLVYGGAWLARMDVATASVASQAAVGGPPSALALAVARRWPELALPGIAVGLLGYAVGNYLGFAAAWLVRGWL